MATISSCPVDDALMLPRSDSLGLFSVCVAGSVEGCFDDNLISCSSHQSSSVTLLRPHLANHCFTPSGTKKWTFLCFLAILRIVGWLMWS